MNFAKAVVVALLVVWLQVATIPAIRIWGVVPNLALVIVVLLASRLPANLALPMAAVIGWLLDNASGSDFGLRTGAYLLVALVVAWLAQLGSDLDNLSLLASLVAALTVLFNLAILASLALLRISLPIRLVGSHIFAEVGLNLLLLLPLRWLVKQAVGRSSHDIAVQLGARRG